MSMVFELLKILIFVLVALFFMGVVSIMGLSACALFGFLSFETATAKAKLVRRNLLRIWLSLLGLMALCMLLSIVFGQK